MTDEPIVPRAQIVDRESAYDKASRIGLAIVGASFSAGPRSAS